MSSQIMPAKLKSVVPHPPSSTKASNHVAPAEGRITTSNLPKVTFWGAFGWFGPLVILILLGSSSWSLFLVFVNLDPDRVANYIMDTADFENGSFWQIDKTEETLVVATSVSYGLISLYYLYVVFLMLFGRQSIVIATAKEEEEQFSSSSSSSSSNGKNKNKIRRKSRSVQFIEEVVNHDGTYRKYWNLIIELPELILQSLTLSYALEDGLQVELIHFYAVCIMINALVGFANVFFGRNHGAFREILTDAFLDMVLAIVVPLVTLVFSIQTFDYDYSSQRIRDQVFEEETFDRNARFFAMPIHIEHFKLGYNSLRVTSTSDFFITLLLNLMACIRWLSIVRVLVKLKYWNLAGQEQRSRTRLQNLAAQKRLPRWISCIFLMFGISIYTYVGKSIVVSQEVCQKELEFCPIHAHRWHYTDENIDDPCRCIAFVKRNDAPKTYDEWINPVDITEDLARLASPNYLRVVQVVNFQLNKIPAELANCTQLRQMILIYTGITEFPAEMGKLTNLEFLHVEGKENVTNLNSMDPSLFDQMHNLRRIHMAHQAELKQFPSFKGLTGLKSLTLVGMPKLENFKSFQGLENLHVLSLKVLPEIYWLPDMTKMTKLKRFWFIAEAAVCCNGYFDHGKCDQKTLPCTDESLCLEDTSLAASDAQLIFFEPFRDKICTNIGAIMNDARPASLPPQNGNSSPPPPPQGGNLPPPPSPGKDDTLPPLPPDDTLPPPPPGKNGSTLPPTPNIALTTITQKNTDIQCGGVLYKQCGDGGMCYNSRFYVIHCDATPENIAVRKKQIAAGLICDVEVEAWLGCR